MKIEKESDALNREYKQLVDMIERLTRKYDGDQLVPRINQIRQRMFQIIQEIEECTGVQITLKTKEDILKENEEIQNGNKK